MNSQEKEKSAVAEKILEGYRVAHGEQPGPDKSAHFFLLQAGKHMQDRAATYDQPEGERSMGKTVAAFNAITGNRLAESEGWLLMALLKQVRLFQRPGFHSDSAEDLIAYSALMAEAKQKEPT